MRKIGLIICLSIITVLGISQKNTIPDVVANLEKGTYVILEVRMQLEDEFQTVEGNQSANLSRVAIFTGINKDKEILSKGFTGFNSVVRYLNQMKDYGFEMQESYPLKGNSLLITHYVFKKIKK
jgi:Holliday junction resolvase